MSKINQLFKHSHSGMVLTLPWLATLGISSKLVWRYIQSSWLERVGTRAFKKAGDEISWFGGMSAAQYQLKLPIHVGAKTALQLLGRTHFVPIQGIKLVYLFMSPGVNEPRWLNREIFPDNIFEVCKTSLFGDGQRDTSSLGVVERGFDGINILLSAPERAIFEVLHLVPNKQTFEEAFLLMEGLTNLRPKMVQLLLESCNSIKVKRLFLHMAEKNNLPWVSELDLKKINLGSGKRKIGEGGVFDSKYQISVPQIGIKENLENYV